MKKIIIAALILSSLTACKDDSTDYEPPGGEGDDEIVVHPITIKKSAITDYHYLGDVSDQGVTFSLGRKDELDYWPYGVIASYEIDGETYLDSDLNVRVEKVQSIGGGYNVIVIEHPMTRHDDEYKDREVMTYIEKDSSLYPLDLKSIEIETPTASEKIDILDIQQHNDTAFAHLKPNSIQSDLDNPVLIFKGVSDDYYGAYQLFISGDKLRLSKVFNIKKESVTHSSSLGVIHEGSYYHPSLQSIERQTLGDNKLISDWGSEFTLGSPFIYENKVYAPTYNNGTYHQLAANGNQGIMGEELIITNKGSSKNEDIIDVVYNHNDKDISVSDSCSVTSINDSSISRAGNLRPKGASIFIDGDDNIHCLGVADFGDGVLASFKSSDYKLQYRWLEDHERESMRVNGILASYPDPSNEETTYVNKLYAGTVTSQARPIQINSEYGPLKNPSFYKPSKWW